MAEADQNGITRHNAESRDTGSGDALVEEVVLRLLIRFGDQMPRSDIEYLVRQASAGFTEARIHSFVPILIEHQAADWAHTIIRERRGNPRRLDQTG